MSAHTYIGMKCEQALVAYLQGEDIGDIPTAQVYGGMSRGVNADEVETEEVSNPHPNVVAYAEAAAEFVPFTGNWEVDVTVEVNSMADDETRSDHETRAGKVFDAIMQDDFDTVLNATADFTLFKMIPGGQMHTRSGREWKSSISFKLFCCGKDLSA